MDEATIILRVFDIKGHAAFILLTVRVLGFWFWYGLAGLEGFVVWEHCWAVSVSSLGPRVWIVGFRVSSCTSGLWAVIDHGSKSSAVES